MLWRKTLLLTTVVAALLALAALYLPEHGQKEVKDGALTVVQSFLRATYARDYRAAYRFLSSADQRVRDETGYIQAQGAFSGFTLEVASKLAEFMELSVIDRSGDNQRQMVKVAYSVPSPQDLSPMVFGWDSEKLNSLSPPERKQLLDTLAARKKDGALITLSGQETFELVREDKVWKVFKNWAAGTKIRLTTTLPDNSDIDVRLSHKEIITTGDEPFQINIQIANRGNQTVVMTMGHVVEPLEAADEMEMIECGLSRPMTLEPGREQEFSMAYLVSEITRKSIREFTVTYAFEINK